MMERLSPAADMAVRWVPDPAAVRAAVAVLSPWDGADVVAFVPMYQPGKTYGVWFTGQEVVTVPGVVFWAARDDGPAPGAADYGWARNAACEAARVAMAGRPGTFGYAVVYPDGEAAVFEDSPPRRSGIGRASYPEAMRRKVDQEAPPEYTAGSVEEAGRLPHRHAGHCCSPRCASYPPAPGDWHEHTETGPAGCGRCSLTRQFEAGHRTPGHDDEPGER
jgi:hypothetical protein